MMLSVAMHCLSKAHYTEGYNPLKVFWTLIPTMTMTELKAQQYTVEKLSRLSFQRYIVELSTLSWSKMASKTVWGG